MNIEIRLDRRPSLEETAALYRTAGWWSGSDSLERLRKILDGTAVFCGAYDGDRLIGMMRALSDRTSDAYLLDLVVVPEYRRQGIGKAITDALSGHLRSMGVDWIVCIGAPGTESFYAGTSARPMKGFSPLRFPGNEPEEAE